jgi:hexosaminidase
MTLNIQGAHSVKLKKTVGSLAMAILSLTASGQTSSTFTNTLLPQPTKLSISAGQLPLTTAFTIATPHFHDARLDAAIQRTLTDLERQTALSLSKVILTGSTATLVVDVQTAGQLIQSLDEDETYSLTVTPTSATLHANTVVGAMYGLQTIQQLLQSDQTHSFFPAVQIEDAPRFRWRGLHLDVSRHFFSVPVIKRTLDGMASVKLNVFHWHLSDDQGFRVESKRFPRLTGLGSDGLFYTQAQVREVVTYARDRGIRVIPEFDMPGHTRSWFVGYPDLASGPGPYTIRREFGIEDAAIDPTRESTYQFLDSLIGEMSTLFPDAYFHVGGDESNGKQWQSNPRIMEFIRAKNLKDTDGLQVYFNQRLLPIVQKYHKHMVGWDEVLHPGLPKDVIIQSWRGAKALTDAATQGYQGILSQPYYLDGMKSAQDNYLADPLPATSTLTPQQRAFVLGGEVCMWAEHIDERSVDSRIWPRTAAVAERFWSPQSVTNVDDMYRRLAVQSIRLEGLGLTHISHEATALRQLAGTENIDPLLTFASALEPVSFGERYKQQHTTQLTPLDNLVDAIRPDPPSRYETERLVQELLTAPTTSEARAQLEQSFQRWINAAPGIEAMLSVTPVLAATLPRAHQLTELSRIGLQALRYLSSTTPAPASWKQQSLTTIEAARGSSALVRFTFLTPLQEMVKAVP